MEKFVRRITLVGERRSEVIFEAEREHSDAEKAQSRLLKAQQRYVDVMTAGFERSTERGAGRWERSQWKTHRKALRKAVDVWDGKGGDE